MDPLSQAALGAACAQSATHTAKRRLAWLACLGALGGLAPDLDVFIRSSSDPLLFLEFHRQFSHSILFIPVGGLLVATLAWRLPRTPLSFRQSYIAATAGYGSHGLLDACTSYGTQLFWPISDMRVSWNNVSVVDPLFTLPLVLLMVLAIWRQRRWLAWLGLGWAVAYLTFGLMQQQRATAAALTLAAQRSHEPAQLLVKPAFGNVLLWKAVYRHQDHYYVDGLRAGLQTQHCGGDKVPVLDLDRHFPALVQDSQQRRDIERFRWFSMDYLAPRKIAGNTLIIDVRYANLPNQINPLWGIRIRADAGAQDHVQWWSNRSLNPQQRNAYLDMLQGNGCPQPINSE